jgi:hypothetical protein
MRANGVIDVIAVTTAKGEYMTTSTTEDRKAHVTGAERANPSKKARVARTRAHVAHNRAKLAPTKAKALKKAPNGAKKAGSARDGSKTAKVLDLLKRHEGASMKELLKSTGWQPHSVRGFLSGTIRKKMGMTVTSTKPVDGERTYSIKA